MKKLLGLPVLTIGQGGSAGAIQQFLITQNYPGLLDAITASAVFPDWVTTKPGIVDCALLEDFYASPVGQSFTAEQRERFAERQRQLDQFRPDS